MPKTKIARLITVSTVRITLLLSWMKTPPYNQKKAKCRASIVPKEIMRQEAIVSLMVMVVVLAAPAAGSDVTRSGARSFTD